MSKYYATSTTTTKIPNRFINSRGFEVEYNPNINMYRLNGKALPDELMGYEMYLSICIQRLKQYLRRKDKNARQ